MDKITKIFNRENAEWLWGDYGVREFVEKHIEQGRVPTQEEADAYFRDEKPFIVDLSKTQWDKDDYTVMGKHALKCVGIFTFIGLMVSGFDPYIGSGAVMLGLSVVVAQITRTEIRPQKARVKVAQALNKPVNG